MLSSVCESSPCGKLRLQSPLMKLWVIPVWQTSINKLRQCLFWHYFCGSHTVCVNPIVTSVLSGSHTDCISPRALWGSSQWPPPSLSFLPLLPLYCHCCHSCNTTATAAKPATLLPFSHSDCISPCVLRPLCARNDLRLLFYSPLHTSYASTIILATTIILAIVLFNHAKCNHACATCHCGIKPVARNCYVVFPILIFTRHSYTVRTLLCTAAAYHHSLTMQDAF